MPVDDVPAEILERFLPIPTSTIYTGTIRHGFHPCYMTDIKNYTTGQKLVGRARTLRYLPPRVDLVAEIRGGVKGELDVHNLFSAWREQNNPQAPEYRAMGRCGPGDVLVCDAMGHSSAANIGDVKAIYLKMQKAEGIITDGAIRDLGAVLTYGFKIFAAGRTAKAAQGVMTEYDENVDIQCGGVLVRPGDIIVGDDDGVVVVPKQAAEEIVAFAEEYEEVEAHILEKVQTEGVSPGTYYPPSEEFIEQYRRERRGKS